MDARAVLVRGSRVVWVGDDPAQAPPHQHRHELDGAVLGPAFVDAHAHLTPLGLGQVTLDLSDVRSGAELLRAVANYAAQHTGRVIWGHGFDPHGFPDALPTPDQLGEVDPRPRGLPVPGRRPREPRRPRHPGRGPARARQRGRA